MALLTCKREEQTLVLGSEWYLVNLSSLALNYDLLYPTCKTGIKTLYKLFRMTQTLKFSHCLYIMYAHAQHSLYMPCWYCCGILHLQTRCKVEVVLIYTCVMHLCGIEYLSICICDLIRHLKFGRSGLSLDFELTNSQSLSFSSAIRNEYITHVLKGLQ